MSKLSEMIARLCPNGVEYKKLGEVARICRGVRVVRKELIENGKYAVYQNSLKPLGYYNEANVKGGTAFVIGAGAAGEVGYSEQDFWAADDCYFIDGGDQLIGRYVYYCLTSRQSWLESKTRKASIPRLSRDFIAALEIPLPPLPVQREIVQILDNFANLTAELTAELAKRKKQYEHYRDMLLNFTGGGRYDKFGVESGEFRVEWKRLGEIAEIGTGSSNTDEQLDEGKYPFFVRSQDVRWKNEYEYDETAIITSGDGVGVGKIFHYHEGKYALHQRAYRVHVFVDQVLPQYIFYYMKNGFLSYIQKNAFQSSVTSLRKPMLLNFPIPLPPLAEQERIVAILDRFDSLCNSLTEGLPAEIALRKKQYEYYRDKLLSFKEAS